MPDNRIAIRIYAEVADQKQALHLADELRPTLLKYGLIQNEWAKPYWKIQSYYELFFDVVPNRDVAEVFEDLMNSFAQGWTVHRFNTGGNWAIWNHSASSRFLLPAIRWANLECYQAAD